MMKVFLSFLTISLIFTMNTYGGPIIQDQHSPAYGFGAQILSYSPIGQTFTAEDAKIQYIGFGIGVMNPHLPVVPVTVELFEGSGTGGTSLGVSTLYHIEPGSKFSDADFSFVTLQVGSVYTALLSTTNARASVAGEYWKSDIDGSILQPDLYTGGDGFWNGSKIARFDLVFRVLPLPETITPPTADANGPYTIHVGDTLTLDASGSTDDDNDIISYMWDLDDNGIFETDAGIEPIFDVDYIYLQSLGLLVDHTYTIHLKVTDSEQQSDIADSTLTIIPLPVIEVAVDIDPNTLNLKSKGKWITCHIWLPESYDVTDVNSYSVILEDEIEAEWIWFDEDQQVIMAKFSRSALQQILVDVETPSEVELLITGELNDGTLFEGTDIIRVINKGPTPAPDARWKGQASSVTTANYIAVDDFDLYVSDEHLRAVWDDYLAHGIFLEADPNFTRDGNSMMYEYTTNTKKVGMGGMVHANPADLLSGPDWTIAGVKALVLYFLGDPCTVIPDLDYGSVWPWVELEDTSSNTGWVKYYDPNHVTEQTWHEWNIDLSILDACGVELSSIERLTIGIGGIRVGQTSKASITNRLWIDDIRLYPPRCIPEVSELVGDFTGDCSVDYFDVNVMSQEWLSAGIKADLVDDDIVNFEDFDVLADNWLAEQLWP